MKLRPKRQCNTKGEGFELSPKSNHKLKVAAIAIIWSHHLGKWPYQHVIVCDVIGKDMTIFSVLFVVPCIVIIRPHHLVK